MKSAKELKDFKEAMQENLTNAQDMETVKYYQGVLKTVEWFETEEPKEEEKKDE